MDNIRLSGRNALGVGGMSALLTPTSERFPLSVSQICLFNGEFVAFLFRQGADIAIKGFYSPVPSADRHQER